MHLATRQNLQGTAEAQLVPLQDLTVGQPSLGQGAVADSGTEQQPLTVEDADEEAPVCTAWPAGSRKGARGGALRESLGSCTPTDMWVEGVQVYEETWGTLGQPGSYRRLMVRCPTCHAIRKRNYDTADSRAGGWGDIEPHWLFGLLVKPA